MEPLWGSTPLPEAPVSGLVLIHGWGMSSGVWDRFPALPGIALQRHPIDLPGHGGSVMPAPGEGGAAALDLWADTCLASAPPRAVWLGWSLGGLVALAAARRAPERIAALVLMTATPRFVRASDWPPAVAAETLSRFYEGLAADPTGTLSRFLALQVRGSDRALETLRHLRQALALRPAPEPEALAQGLELLRDQDLRPLLPRLQVPTLWLFGSHDTLVPAAVAPRIEALIPGTRTRVIAGAAHAPFLSHPLETAEAIAAFLADLRTPLASGGPASMGPERWNLTPRPGSNGYGPSFSR